jgi:hypothetical protein
MTAGACSSGYTRTAQVLIMEGHEEIAKEADAALQRLLDLPKFKGKDWAQMLELAQSKKTGKKKKK